MDPSSDSERDRLKRIIDLQAIEIADLRKPRHWRSRGVRGAQALAWHETLDRLIDRAVQVRRTIRRLPRGDGKSPVQGARSEERLATLSGVVMATGADDDLATQRTAFLGLLALTGRAPDDPAVERLSDQLTLAGANDLRAARRLATELFEPETSFDAPLRVVTDQILVDVTQTVGQGFHTGIQRVVSETAGRWSMHADALLVWWDDRNTVLRPVAEDDVARLRDWASSSESAHSVPHFDLDAGPTEIILPIGTTIIIPEVVPEARRISHYVSLSRLGLAEIALIGYDMIPISASETRPGDADAWFARYLTLVKHARRVAAISESTATEFRAFKAMLPSQGIAGPEVVTCLLPTVATPSDDADLAETAEQLAIGPEPMVLMVGSSEPRKNQRAVMHAAERLWRSGSQFQLVITGGWGWSSDNNYEMARSLIERGRRITFIGPCSERRLWSLYRLARFCVFPSLLEGFGLPIAESLACGTPVIASQYGAMAEIAAGGGTLLVDPRSIGDLADAMRRLLEDDDLLARLREQAAARPGRPWTAYADELWAYFTADRAGRLRDA